MQDGQTINGVLRKKEIGKKRTSKKEYNESSFNLRGLFGKWLY